MDTNPRIASYSLRNESNQTWKNGSARLGKGAELSSLDTHSVQVEGEDGKLIIEDKYNYVGTGSDQELLSIKEELNSKYHKPKIGLRPEFKENEIIVTPGDIGAGSEVTIPLEGGETSKLDKGILNKLAAKSGPITKLTVSNEKGWGFNDDPEKDLHTILSADGIIDGEKRNLFSLTSTNSLSYNLAGHNVDLCLDNNNISLINSYGEKNQTMTITSPESQIKISVRKNENIDTLFIEDTYSDADLKLNKGGPSGGISITKDGKTEIMVFDVLNGGIGSSIRLAMLESLKGLEHLRSMKITRATDKTEGESINIEVLTSDKMITIESDGYGKPNTTIKPLSA
jgi:hypothetical protein